TRFRAERDADDHEAGSVDLGGGQDEAVWGWEPDLDRVDQWCAEQRSGLGELYDGCGCRERHRLSRVRAARLRICCRVGELLGDRDERDADDHEAGSVDLGGGQDEAVWGWEPDLDRVDQWCAEQRSGLGELYDGCGCRERDR